MKNTPRPGFALDLVFKLQDGLIETDTIDVVQRLLLSYMPEWTRVLRINDEAITHSVDRSEKDSLRKNLLRSIHGRGQAFANAVDQFGPVPLVACGIREIMGADANTMLVITADERVFVCRGRSWRVANEIALQFRSDRVEGTQTAKLAIAMFDEFCRELGPLYAYGGMVEEFAAQNLVTDNGTYAVGTDISRHLPGTYWLNFLGSPYLSLISTQRLSEAFKSRCVSLDDGFRIMAYDNPTCWSEADAMEAKNVLRVVAGERLFFDRTKPDAETIAPNFGLR